MDGSSTDFALPSAKRIRVEEQPEDIQHQQKAAPSNPGTPVDDLDDLYGTPATGTPLKRSEEATVQPVASQLPPQNPSGFKVPGLGLLNDEARPDSNDKGTGSAGGVLGAGDLEAPRSANEAPTKSTRDTQSVDEPALYNAQEDPSQQNLDLAKSDSEGMNTLSIAAEGPTYDTEMATSDAPCNITKHSYTEMSSTEVLTADKAPAVSEPAASDPVEMVSLEVATDDRTASRLSEPLMDVERKLAEQEPGALSAANLPQPTNLQEPTTTAAEAIKIKSHGFHAHTAGNLQHTGDASSLSRTKEDVEGADKMNLDAEFEIDSSPIESSTDSSSDSSSSDLSDDYEMLDPEEQARRLMQDDGGSDGEGAQGTTGTTNQLRTLNEKPDEIVPKPNITITAEMKIQELGDVENLVDNLALIKAKTSGEYQVLESGSVLCLADRSVIGVVAETLGRVYQPYYSVRFTNAAGIAEAGISKGTSVFYSEQHSTTVLTEALKAIKGSDASNLHDEEVADDEIEFSDDEAEAEYKRKQKQERLAKKEARFGTSDGFSRGPGGRGGNRGRGRGRSDRRGGRSNGHPRDSGSGGVNHDDMDTDELYTPLARPSNLHEMMGRNEAPTESRNSCLNVAGSGHDRGSGDYGRGRGGQERGDRSRGQRGGRGDRRGHGSYENHGYNSHPQDRVPNPYNQPQYPLSQTNQRPFHQSPPEYESPTPFSYGQQNGYTPRQNAPHNYGYNYTTMPQYQSQFQGQTPSPQTPVPNVPPGAFINPAFFAQAYQNPNVPQAPFPSNQYSQNSSMPFNRNSG